MQMKYQDWGNLAYCVDASGQKAGHRGRKHWAAVQAVPEDCITIEEFNGDGVLTADSVIWRLLEVCHSKENLMEMLD